MGAQNELLLQVTACGNQSFAIYYQQHKKNINREAFDETNGIIYRQSGYRMINSYDPMFEEADGKNEKSFEICNGVDFV